ncbi:hypothetical protein JCM31598_37410 [Desulfonatronum parangueonense]
MWWHAGPIPSDRNSLGTGVGGLEAKGGWGKSEQEISGKEYCGYRELVKPLPLSIKNRGTEAGQITYCTKKGLGHIDLTL